LHDGTTDDCIMTMMTIKIYYGHDGQEYGHDDGLPFKTSGPEGHSNNEQSGPRRPKAYTTFNER